MTRSCPKCDSKAFKRNGYTRHGKQNHRCLDCGRQFSFEPEIKYVLDVAPNSEGQSGQHQQNCSHAEIL